MADVQNFQKRIEIRLNRSEVTNYLLSICRTPAPQPDGTVTIKEEPRNENELSSVIVKTESPDNPEQEVSVSSVQVKGFNCPTCHLTFKYHLHLRDHQSKHQKCAVQYNPISDVKLDPDADTPHFNGQVKLVHSCPKCKKEFGKPSRLQHHITTVHSNERPYVCSKCLHAFKELGNCDRHNRKEHKFNCEKCELSFVKKSSLQKHARNVHLESRKYFSCNQCKKEFARPYILKRHIASVHSNERPYVCSTCLHTFKELSNLNAHARKEHKFKCANCELSFVSQLSLNEHVMRSHQVEFRKYFSCPECKKDFAQSDTLKRHIASVHSNERPYVCSTCLHTFTVLGNRDSHARKEHKFKCENCELSFVLKLSLKEHVMKSHQAESRKNFSCPECKREFKRYEQLCAHMNMKDHTNKQVFVYSTCQKTFNWRRYFNQHTQKEHLFKCENCELSFVQKLCLEVHELKCHPDKITNKSFRRVLKCNGKSVYRIKYSCSECKKAFPTAKQLRLHKTVHSNARPYVCSACQKAFKWKEVLAKHTREVHSTKNSADVMSHISSLDEAPDPSLGVTIKDEPRTEDDLSVFVKTESLHRPDQEVCANGKGFQCPTCQLTFKYRLHLKHHHSTKNGCTVQHNLIDHVKFEK